MVQRRTWWTGGLRSMATLLCLLLVFYGLPLRAISLDRDWVGLMTFVIGSIGLVWLITSQIRRLASGAAQARGWFLGVLTAVYLVVTFFSLTYYALEQSDPSQFVGLETRTDALYYTVVTLGTVGFGDIYAAGQAARVATIVQISIDLVLIGALLALSFSHLTLRITRNG